MEKLIIIKTIDQLEELRQYIKDNDFIAFDTETTGVDKESKIIGFSISSDTSVAYYVVLAYWDVEEARMIELETSKYAKELLSLLVGKSLIMHNGVFDCAMVKNNYQIELIQDLHTDTMILAHLLDENRHNGLKELAVTIFGEDSRDEQLAMKESVHDNGGVLTKDKYELYKANADLIAKYGAKDAILTMKLFYIFTEQLFEQGLDTFFYDDESMPLLRGPTYDLNTIGLKVDAQKLQELKSSLEVDCLEAKAFIYKEITPHVLDKYPGTKKTNGFNIGSGAQIAWLLFEKLGNEFVTLTKGGKDLCKELNLKVPYTAKAKREFITTLKDNFGRVYTELRYNPKTKKTQKPKKIKEYWTYLSSDKHSLAQLSDKYKWVEKLLYLTKQETILDTYVLGIQGRMKYGIISPSFLQHGTTSGRYSSKNPNFQNLPRDDKRVKKCIVSRPGKVFVGADYAQLEPRVFASMSGDQRLMDCFAKGEDFYSVVGAPIFNKTGYSMVKSAKDSFAANFPTLRDRAKVIALATPYGRTASFTASQMGIKREEAQDLMDKYFEAYGKVELMMLESHEQAKGKGVVHSLFGRPRRIPDALNISKRYGTTDHSNLPYEARTLLNLGMNHRIQSTGASIMNRAAIRFKNLCQEANLESSIVMQVHDELIVECKEQDSNKIVELLKEAMENTVKLPGVDLVAEPKVASNLGDLK